jgi:hypothetical protein
MAGLRRLIQARWSGRLFTVGLAYLLAIDALVAGIGTGMSAVADPGQAEFAICSSVADHGLVAPSSNDERNKSDQQSQCPYCFLAAQSADHLATTGGASTSPAYADLHVTGLHYGTYNGGILVPSLYRTSGDPRGPPHFSV